MTSLNFNELLKANWNILFASFGDKIFRNSLNSVHLKEIDEYLAYFNSSLIENKRKTQIDFGDEEFKDKFIEEIKLTSNNVFKNFDDDKFNFNKINPKEILFYANLDEESIITKEKIQKDEEDINFDEDQLNDEISKFSLHPVLANISPICKYHSLLPVFPTEELPQVIGSDILVLLLQAFKMSNSETLRSF